MVPTPAEQSSSTAMTPRLWVAGSVLCIIGLTACAQADDQGRTPQAEYTAENPGEWIAVRESHAPQIRVERDVLRVEVPLRKIDRSHYIEKIGIMDGYGRDVVPPVAFAREASDAITVYANLPISELRGDLSEYKVYAKCNLHDLWTAPLETE